MARKSRPNYKNKQTKNVTAPSVVSVPTVNRTGIYVRLSLCDTLYHIREDSIQTQISILKDYLAHHPDLYLTKEYIDRGWSGINFQRPAFLQMIEDIKAGKINCILVKDFSRFGRNYWETGYFLEVLLPQLHVRFISIADQFDSLTSDPGTLAVILKNIVNDFYSRDLSRRFCDSYDLKKAQGVFYKGQPYGYRYDPDRPPHLIFDPDVCHYVRLMFAWALEGVSCNRIARRLTEMKAPTMERIEYLRHKGKTKHKGTTRWNTTTVIGMLKDRTYAGDFVCGKTYVRKCDPYHVRPQIPEDEWVVIQNSHPGYITHEEYEKIRRHLDKINATQKKRIQKNLSAREQYPDIYKRKLYCSHCGRKLRLNLYLHQNYHNKMHYVCQFTGSRTEDPHERLSINKRTLDILILHQIQEQCILAESLWAWLSSQKGKRIAAKLLQKKLGEWHHAKKQCECVKAEQAALFERQADSLISSKNYAVKQNELRDALRKASIKMEEADDDRRRMQTALSSDNPWLRLFLSFPFPNEINQKLVDTAIEQIRVLSSDDAQAIFFHQAWFTPLWETYQASREDI